MNKKIVKFSNKMNEIGLIRKGGLTSVELTLFYTLLHLIKENPDKIFEIDGAYVRETSGYGKKAKKTRKEFRDDLASLFEKLKETKYKRKDGEKEVEFELFKWGRSPKDSYCGKDEDFVIFRVNPKFQSWFNNKELKANFTLFELDDILSLRGTYAKEMYRFLMQFKSTGVWRVGIEDFRRLMGVPESYRFSAIYQNVTGPSIQKMTDNSKGKQIFKEVELLKNKNYKGEITGYVFKFKKPDVVVKKIETNEQQEAEKQKVLSDEDVKENKEFDERLKTFFDKKEDDWYG